jgi:hypothetical protein
MIRTSRLLAWLTCGVTLGTAGSDLSTQSVAATPLSGKPTEVATTFSSIYHLTELADGRVVLFDALERRLGVADVTRGSFTDIARQGAGPLEYRNVHAIHRVSGDTLLLWDPSNDRILAFAPDATPLGVWPLAGRDAWSTMLTRSVPRAVDAARRWYVPLRPVTSGDTTTLVRMQARSMVLDTLARYGTTQLRPVRAAAGQVKVIAPGFPPVDAWGVFPDGRVLFVHGASYEPEIISVAGERRRAAKVPFTPLPVTTAERARHLREAAAELKRMLGNELAGGRGGSMPMIVPEGPELWPATMPPIRESLIRIDSKSRAWVAVADAATATGDRFDLLDANGRRLQAVRLPEGMRLVGMGKEVLYLTKEDEDGLLHLLRYPLP